MLAGPSSRSRGASLPIASTCECSVFDKSLILFLRGHASLACFMIEERAKSLRVPLMPFLLFAIVLIAFIAQYWAAISVVVGGIILLLALFFGWRKMVRSSQEALGKQPITGQAEIKLDDKRNCKEQIARYREAQARINQNRERRRRPVDQRKEEFLLDVEIKLLTDNEVREAEKTQELIRELLAKVRKLCKIHSTSLSQEKRRLLRKDAYGNVLTEAWDHGPSGIQYFIDSVLKPSLGSELWSEVIASSNVSAAASLPEV